MEKTEEVKKMTLRDILEYAEKKGLNAGSLLKLQETYKELLEPEERRIEGFTLKTKE